MSMLDDGEKLLLFSKPAEWWPVLPTPHMSAFHRWRLTGVQGVNGQQVFLETMKLGGRRYTSKEAVARFIAAQNQSPEPIAARSAVTVKREASEATRALRAMMPKRRAN